MATAPMGQSRGCGLAGLTIPWKRSSSAAGAAGGGRHNIATARPHVGVAADRHDDSCSRLCEIESTRPLVDLTVDIKRPDVRRFVDTLVAAGRGATTVRRIIAVVQGALTAAMRDDIIAANPARGVRLPTVDAHEFEPWTPVQVGAFLDRAAQHRLGALFEVAVMTGLRRAELVGLRWGDLDLARRELTVRSTRVQASGEVVENSPKTSAGRRVVQLDDAAVGALVAWQITQDGERSDWDDAWLGSGYVFTYENGEPLRPQYVTRLFDSLRRDVGLPAMTLHGLRHMHASLLLASGADIALVSKRLGHSSISVTSDIYTHLIGDAARRAAESASALVPRATAQRVHNHGMAADMTEARNLATSA